MEDGLLVPNHLAVPDRQGVIAALQVKVLKCQLDYLDDSGDIAKTTVIGTSLNTCDTRCRGETPPHLRPRIPLTSFNPPPEYVLHDVRPLLPYLPMIMLANLLLLL